MDFQKGQFYVNYTSKKKKLKKLGYLSGEKNWKKKYSTKGRERDMEQQELS